MTKADVVMYKIASITSDLAGKAAIGLGGAGAAIGAVGGAAGAGKGNRMKGALKGGLAGGVAGAAVGAGAAMKIGPQVEQAIKGIM